MVFPRFIPFDYGHPEGEVRVSRLVWSTRPYDYLMYKIFTPPRISPPSWRGPSPRIHHLLFTIHYSLFTIQNFSPLSWIEQLPSNRKRHSSRILTFPQVSAIQSDVTV